MKTELLSRLFSEKAQSFGITRTAPHKEGQQNFRNFLDYVHKIGGWIITQIGDKEDQQLVSGHTIVTFYYQTSYFPSDVKAKMILAVPEDFALKATVLGYLP